MLFLQGNEHLLDFFRIYKKVILANQSFSVRATRLHIVSLKLALRLEEIVVKNSI